MSPYRVMYGRTDEGEMKKKPEIARVDPFKIYINGNDCLVTTLSIDSNQIPDLFFQTSDGDKVVIDLKNKTVKVDNFESWDKAAQDFWKAVEHYMPCKTCGKKD